MRCVEERESKRLVFVRIVVYFFSHMTRTAPGVDIKMSNDDVVYGTGVVSCPECGSVRIVAIKERRRRCLDCKNEWKAKRSVLPPFVEKDIKDRR